MIEIVLYDAEFDLIFMFNNNTLVLEVERKAEKLPPGFFEDFFGGRQHIHLIGEI